MKRSSVVAVANEKVPIAAVCRMLGVAVPDDVSRSWKLHCPFGATDHSDGGIEPALRIYTDSNSAYCFSCASYFSPVSLAAHAWGMLRRQAAVTLLDRIGYRPLDFATAWQSAKQYEPEPDTAQLADALKTYCRRIEPRWSTRQFDPSVAAVLTRCLNLLDLVKTGDDVSLWLVTCKRAMYRAMLTEQIASSATRSTTLGDYP